MNLQQLYYFRKVAELEHYTRAAKDLCISQPSLSYAISELEKELEVQLFYKIGRNIRLTKYGEIFLVHVNKSLSELEYAKRKITDLISPDTGKIIISHISSTNVAYIPFLIRKFYEDIRNQGVSLDFIENPTKVTIDKLKSREIDVGIGSFVNDDKISFIPIFKEDLIVIVGENHPLANRSEIDLHEALDYELISYSKNCGIRFFIDEIFKELGLSFKIERECENNTMITGMVSSGIGIAIVPRIFGHKYYNVKPIEIVNVNTERHVYMLLLKNDKPASVVKRFIDFVSSISNVDGFKIE